MTIEKVVYGIGLLKLNGKQTVVYDCRIKVNYNRER